MKYMFSRRGSIDHAHDRSQKTLATLHYEENQFNYSVGHICTFVCKKRPINCHGLMTKGLIEFLTSNILFVL